MKTKFKKFIVIALMAVCVMVCLSLGMANMKSGRKDSVPEDAVADADPGIETYTIYNAQSDWEVEYVDGKYLITAYYGSSKTPTVPYIEVDEDYYVTGLGDGVFKNSNITSITLNWSISSIGKQCFYGCTSLKTVNDANYITSIGSQAFYNCSSLTSFTLRSGITTIPERAFEGCSSLISMEIPSSVTTIGTYAFYNCKSWVSDVVIPSGVTSIPQSVFQNCSSLTSMEIGDGVTEIRGTAFCGCSSLKSLTIGKGVTSVETSAFSGCTALEKVYFNAVAMEDLSNDNYVFSCMGNSGSGVTVTIGAEVTRIPEYMFYSSKKQSLSVDTRNNDLAGNKITSVIFETGSKCASIGKYAFAYECDYLTSIVIPDSVTSIDNYAFYDCQSLASVTIGSSVTCISFHAFAYCGSLTSMKIPGGVTSIDGYAFYECTSLTSITIGSGVTYIGVYAFNGTGITSAVFEDPEEWYCSECDFSSSDLSNVSTAAKYLKTTYYKCSWYKREPDVLEYTLSSDGTYYILTKFNNDEGTCTDVVIDSTYESLPVKEIAASVFKGHTEITSVTIPESIATIGDYAFGGCSSLKSATFKSTEGWSVSKSGTQTYLNSSNLSNTSTAATYLRSTYYTYTWTRTESALLEYTLSSDGTYYILTACTGNFTSVVIDSTYNSLPVKEIASSVFEGHTEITSVTIPESITAIGDYAFSGCIYVTSICFNATSMNDLAEGNGVFYNTGKNGDGITMTIGANVTRIPAYFLCPSPTTGTIYPPKINAVTYQSGSVCTEIGDYAFCNTDLSEFSIPSGVTHIGTMAFAGTDLTSITIPSAVKTVGAGAFESCKYLEEIFFNATAMDDLEADNLMFWSDYSSSSKVTITVTIGAGVTRIPAHLFSTTVVNILGIELVCAPRVEAVIFESGSRCTEIGAGAFYTSYLKELYVDDLASFLAVDFADEYANPLAVVSLTDGAFYLGKVKTTTLTAENTSGVTRVGSYALAYCTTITDVALGENVSYIGAHAFEGMSKLKSFTLPYYSGWTVYASSALSSGTKIIPDELEKDALSYFTSTYVSYVWMWECVSNVAPVVECKEVTSGGYTSGTFTVTAVVDASSSIWYIAYTDPNGVTFTSYYDATWTVTPSVNGTYEFVAVDTDGFTSETYYIIFDNTAPELYLGGAAAWANYNSAEFSVLAVDNLDGDVKLYYSLEGEDGEWIICDSNPYTVTPDSECSTDGYWWFKAVDAAGNSTPAYRTVLDTVAVFGSWEYYDDMSLYFSYSAPSYTSWTCRVNGVEYTSGSPFSKDLTTYTAVLTSPNGSTLTAEKFLDHYFPDEGDVVDPTCQSMGYTIYTCVYCGETQLGNFLSACDHEYQEVTVDATCTTNGYSRAECVYCGAVKEGSYQTIYATGHKAVSGAYKAPTCTDAGYYGTVCEVCGTEIETTPVEALGHLLTTETVPSTCVTYGYSLTYCTRDGCDYSVKNALTGTDAYLTDHVYGDVLRVSATCTDDGYTYEQCTVCGYEHTTILHATGHDFGQYYEAEDSETGLVTRWHTCKMCGFTESFELSSNADTAANGVIDIFQKYQKYMWWILLAFVGIWSLFIGLRYALSRNDEEKVKAKSMLANYILGLFVIAVVLVGLPYLIYGIAILVG